MSQVMHSVRSDDPTTIEKDMNIVVRPTYIHGGYLNWLCDNDLIDVHGPGDRLHRFPKRWSRLAESDPA